MTYLFPQDLVLRELFRRFEVVGYDTVFATRSTKDKEADPIRDARLRMKKEAEIVHIPPQEDRMNLQTQISLENKQSESNTQKENI